MSTDEYRYTNGLERISRGKTCANTIHRAGTTDQRWPAIYLWIICRSYGSYVNELDGRVKIAYTSMLRYIDVVYERYEMWNISSSPTVEDSSFGSYGSTDLKIFPTISRRRLVPLPYHYLSVLHNNNITCSIYRCTHLITIIQIRLSLHKRKTGSIQNQVWYKGQVQ